MKESMMSECLSIPELETLLNRSGTAEQITTWRRHLRVCDSCASSLIRLQANGGDSGTSVQEDLPRPKSGGHCYRISHLEPNTRIGDFQIEKRLGAGGMGVVYQSLQLSLNRHVALKVLQKGLAMSESSIQRFHREAQAAAKLHHTNIVGIHAEGEEDGVCYYAMDLIQGRSLDKILAELRSLKSGKKDLQQSEEVQELSDVDDLHAGDVPTPKIDLCDMLGKPQYFDIIAGLIADIADALDYAHKRGVIHLDVKPSNLILGNDGKLSLMDFGVARMCESTDLTMTGTFIGTVQYMSPEQLSLKRSQLDHYTDIYSLGATLYELLTLELPFDGDHREQLITQIMKSEPRRPRQIDSRIPIDLETICCKAMEKEAQRRYSTAAEFSDDLRRYINNYVIKAKRSGPVDKLVKFVHRNKLAVTLSAIILITVVTAGMTGWRYFTSRWVQQHAIPRIIDLMEEKDYFEALALVRKARRYTPDDPLLIGLWPKISSEYSVRSTPVGAKVYYSKYQNAEPDWIYLGRTPLQNLDVPYGSTSWKVEREGFEAVESVRSNPAPDEVSSHNGAKDDSTMNFTLHRKGKYPADMVYIPGFNMGGVDTVPIPEFLIDKYEVSNKLFQEFVDSGGYLNSKYWKHEFNKDGSVLSWEDAIGQFRDSTGHPGPSMWINGHYPEGRGNYPVSGVSWYEAAAYAEFRGKSLPTVYHWKEGAVTHNDVSEIIRFSNFNEDLSEVGHYKGMGYFGLYDTAGNVAEWCYNGEVKKNLHHTRGGAWSDYKKLMSVQEVSSAWERSQGLGFRCVRFLTEEDDIPSSAFGQVKVVLRDFSNFKHATEQEFQYCLETLYNYDKTELNSAVEFVDDSQKLWRVEKVSFDAAYSNERVPAYLYIPRGVKPPYQVVIFVPGGGAFKKKSSDYFRKDCSLSYIVESGRVLMCPIYKGTYERWIISPAIDTNAHKDMVVQISKDLRRSIDYLETRNDIDIERIGYLGLSWGAIRGPLLMSVEERIRAGIYIVGGFAMCGCDSLPLPAVDAPRYTPFMMAPVLMINGEYDFICPYYTQRFVFDTLGVPDEHKRHVVYPTGHVIAEEYAADYKQKINDWLDTYLGPVNKISDNIDKEVIDE